MSEIASLIEKMYGTIYKAAHKEAGQLALKDFYSKWQKAYPKVVKSLQDNATS